MDDIKVNTRYFCGLKIQTAIVTQHFPSGDNIRKISEIFIRKGNFTSSGSFVLMPVQYSYHCCQNQQLPS